MQMLQPEFKSVVLERRVKLFHSTCKGLMSSSLLVYGLAIIHPDRTRAISLLITTTIYVLVSLSVLHLTRRRRLTMAVNLLSGCATLIVTASVLSAGKMTPALWFYVFSFSIANFHIRERHIVYMYLFTLMCACTVWVHVTVVDPMQMPALIVLLTIMALLSYFGARVTKENTQDILSANDELLQANIELAHARKQADAANQAKSLFLATMSHELRTPLNAVIGYAEMMRETIEDEGTIDAQESLLDLEQIEYAGKHLLNLVSGVLDLTRIETERIYLETNYFPLIELLDAVTSMIEPLATRKGLQLKLEVEQDVRSKTMRQDRMRLEQILLNLLENAVKFTQCGEIVLRATALEEQGAVCVDVVDSGVGISQEDQERIFDLFTQVDNSFTREADGMGIGLFLCRKIAERLGGSLTVKSTPGEGASFRLLVPESAME